MLTEFSPSRDLLSDPLWREEDLGHNLPDHPHATSVALPLWAHVIGYEEKDPAVLAAMHCGYPRFVVHPRVRELFQRCLADLAGPGEGCFVFPAQAPAQRCVYFILEKTGLAARSVPVGRNGVHAVVFPETAFETAKKYWQHFGEIVSSRLAQATLEERGPYEGTEAKPVLCARVASLCGAAPEEVWLYPSGMAALAGALRAAQRLRPGKKSVQLGFPYVDLLKIQSVTGAGVHFIPRIDEAGLHALESLLQREQVSAVFCEVPGNPLLQCVDLPRLSTLLRTYKVPLVVDDTPGTFANIDVLPYADMVATSLTKSFAGVGDVMAGSAVLNAASPFAPGLREQLGLLYEDLLWEEDAAALERNSRDFLPRMAQINATAEALCDYLVTHPKVARVYYPKYETPEQYAKVMRPGGGYSCLFSLLLQNAAVEAPRFYDALRVCKGPSLGLNFTISCPYILLAHYDELDWVESVGIDRNLVRVSVGLENAEELIRRFKDALA